MAYRGLAPALTDLVGGQIQVLFSSIAAAIQYIKAGKLHALAVTSAVRAEALPDVPTVGEFVPGVEATQWYDLVAPKGTPAEIVEGVNKQINAGLADPRLKAKFASLGGMVLPGSPVISASFSLKKPRNGAVIRTAHIKPV